MKRLAELFKKRSGKPKQLKSQRRQLLMEGLERREVFAVGVGDIAFTALQADNSGGGANGDMFEFVAINPIASGDTIFFTDSGYRTDNSNFRTNENLVRWVAQSNIAAGTKISFVAPNGTGPASTAEWTGINTTTGAALTTASLALAGGGDNITALINPTFGGTDLLNGTPIAAITLGGATFAAIWTASSGNASTALPPGLTDGTNAVSIAAADNGRYNPDAVGSVESGTAAEVRTSVNTDTFWETSNTPLSGDGRTLATFTIGSASPEINLKGNNVSILDNDTTPSTTDGTDFGSLVTGAAVVSRTFTIENTGAATLNLSGTPIVSISGGSNFSITTQPVGNTVAAAGSTTFVVTFASTTIGTQTATISIANDDSDENPYNFDITGIVSAAATPEVNLQGNGINIADGDNTPSTADDTDYGSQVAGTAAITRTFTIQNLGSGPLDLTGSPNVTITGSADFTVTTQPGADPVAAGSSTTFVVTFTPTTVGTQTATISIANDDSDENPYNFDVSGVVLAAIPEANVLGNGVNIVDGDTTPSSTDHTLFAAAAVGGTSSRTFTIQNTGTVDLTLGAFTSSNPLFTIPSPPTGPVAAGGSVTFSVVFTPSVASTETSTISFVNNDSDENPYDFVVSATGVAIEPLLISELLFNPPGTDAPNEYVEIRGTANSAIPSGTYLVGIEGDTTGAGDVQTIFDLGGLTIGSNGFLVIRQSGNTYIVDGSATTVTATGTGFQTGAGFSADSGTDIENASATYMLIRSAVAPTLSDDIDSDNDGIADGSVFSNWSVADSVAVIDSAADAAYSNFVFSTAATFVGSSGKNVVVTSATSNIVARIGSSTGDAAADWVGGDLVGTSPNFALSPTNTFPATLRGARLNHIGSANNFVAAGLLVTQSGGTTEVTEGGATDSYTVALSSQPLADVTVTLTPDAQLDLGAGAAIAVTLMFTTANWNVAQSVTVSAINDDTAEGVHSGVISHTIAAGSSTDYLGLDVSATNVTVTINDPNNPLATPTITITSGNVVYSNSVYVATASVTGFNSPDPSPSLEFTYFSDAAGATVISAPENVGTYYVRASTTANAGNNASQSAITQFQITPFGLTATATAANKVYDGNTTGVVTIGLTGVFAGDTVTGSASGTFDTKNVGTGKTVTVGSVTLAGTDAGNYTVGSAGNTTADITAKALTITAPSVASKVYDGLAAAGAVTVGTLSGFVGSETVTATAVASAYSSANVGSYSTTVSYTLANGTNGGLASNYSLANGSATGQVTPAPLTVTAEAKSKTVGQVDPPLTFTTSALASGDTAATALTGSLARAAGESVGTYAINQGTLAAVNGNYSISYVAANFTINPAAAAPTLTSVVVNGADTFLNQAQRSMVTSVVVTFSAPVILTAGAFSITNIGLFTASSINLAQSQILVTPNATNDVYTLRFAAGTSVNTRLGTGVLGNSLADGSYRLTVDSTKVSNAGGNLTGNNVFGAAAADNFFRMYGDANGDGTVNAIDRSALQAALSASNAALDFDGNGSTSAGVDTTNYFSNNYKRRRLF